ncbi:flagellar motor protein MotB [Dongia sp. agr-C8]
MTTGAAEYPNGAAASTESDPSTHEARVAELKAAMPQWLDAAAGFKPAVARNPSLPTLVGLLILVMCFFVVLTSISLRNTEREQSVMSGLSRAFSNTGLAPSTPVGEEAETRKLLGDLRASLNAEVPLVSGVKPETADDYVLNLPRRLVFDGDGAKLASGFDGILAQAIRALKTGPADFAYEVEVALTAPKMDDAAIAGAGAVGAALREAGFANDAASVSLIPGDGQMISLTIRLRPNARLPGSP